MVYDTICQAQNLQVHGLLMASITNPRFQTNPSKKKKLLSFKTEVTLYIHCYIMVNFYPWTSFDFTYTNSLI